MNTKNTNSELGFQDFSRCDYNKHWSFSNFNRHLIAAEQIRKLPKSAIVVELGSGIDSPLKNMVIDNFGRYDLLWFKVDGDAAAEGYCEIVDLNNINEVNRYFGHMSNTFRPPDCIVMMEVIEHLDKDILPKLLRLFYNYTTKDATLILSAPTPPFDYRYEKRVWPDDHEHEPCYSQLKNELNAYYKVEDVIGWSLEQREFNRLLKDNMFVREVYCKLKPAFPESYLRAFISSLVDPIECRQNIFICKRRRVPNC